MSGRRARKRHERPGSGPPSHRSADHRRPDLRRPDGDRDRRRMDRRQPAACRSHFHVRQPRQLSAVSGAFVHFRRRHHGARRHGAASHRIHAVPRRRHSRVAWARDHRLLRGVRRHVGLERRLRRGDRKAHGPGAAQERLWRDVFCQPGDGVGRDRRDHSAFDSDDHLRDRRPAVCGGPLSRRLPAGNPGRRRTLGLCVRLRAAAQSSGRRPAAVGQYPACGERGVLGRARAGRHPRRHLWRRLHADGSRRRRLHLRDRYFDVRLPRDVACRSLADHARLGGADCANPGHRLRGGGVRLVDHDERAADQTDHVRRWARASVLDTAGGDQCAAAVRRQRARTAGGDLDPDPLAHADRLQGRDRPIHFGIIVTINLAIGMFMPPFGRRTRCSAPRCPSSIAACCRFWCFMSSCWRW